MARRPWILLLCCLALVGCDHATKRAAHDHLRGQPPVEVVAGAIDLEYAENPGVAFSIERAIPAPARTPLIAGGALLALGVLGVAWWRRRREVSARTAGYALIAAGALGNVADRVRYGHVIDFVHVRHWPIFNVADVCLAVGVGLVLWAARRPLAAPAGPG